jgi:hypothetical protein
MHCTGGQKLSKTNSYSFRKFSFSAAPVRPSLLPLRAKKKPPMPWKKPLMSFQGPSIKDVGSSFVIFWHTPLPMLTVIYFHSTAKILIKLKPFHVVGIIFSDVILGWYYLILWQKFVMIIDKQTSNIGQKQISSQFAS